MKQTLHTSRRAFKLALFCLMLMLIGGGNYCLAQEVTLDFTQNGWKLPAKADNQTEGKYTYDGFTISIDASKNFYYNSGYLMLKSTNTAVGKLTLPAFDFAVEKIEVVGNTVGSVSTKTKENIYVGNTAVSTEETGSKGTNSFVINKQYQAAGNRYTLQVSAANAQITYIKIYKKAVDLTATTLTLSAIPTEPIAIGGTFSSTPTLKAGEQTLSDKTITWSSDNEKVATVDANGTVTGVAAGNAKITAKFAGDDTYKTSTASYEIIVKGAPSLSFPQTSYTVEMGDVFSEPTLQGLPTGVTAKYSSSNADVATVDESTGKVQIVGVGTTTIKAVSEAKDVYEVAEASYELTVNRATSKEVTIDFSTFGLENDKEVGNLKVDGITITFKGKSTLPPKWYNTGTAVRLYSGNQLTISSNNVIRSVIFICDGGGKNMTTGNTALSAGVYNAKTNTWDLSGANEKVVTLKNTLSSGHFRIQKIIVTTDVSVGTITIATPEGFGTYYNSNSYILPEGLTAFGYKEANTDGTLVKTDVFNAGDVVPANAALVVKGNTGDYECYATDQAATKTLEGNLLKGVAAQTEITVESGIKRYVLTKVNGVLGFYQTQSGNIKVPANRAYLELTEAQAQAVSFFQLDGETTGIENATATTKEAPKAIYTLSGVRLKATTTQGLPAGAYVVNGKVVIVK